MVSIVYVLLLFANFFIKCLHEFLFYAKLKLIQEFIKNTPAWMWFRSGHG